MSKRLLVLISGICLILILAALPFISACAPSPDEEVVVTVRSSGFGSVAYTIASGVETLALERHPWMRLQAVESPGGGSDVVQLLTNPDWSDSIITLSALWDIYASRGVGGVEPEQKFPDARDRVRDLLVMSCYNFMFVTLDPGIKTERDLAGKRIGLGRIGQGVWGGLATVAFEEAWPELEARLDYLGGPKEAVAALLDGKVDAAVMGASVAADLSMVGQTPAMVDIVASGRDFYYVGFTEEGLSRFKQVAPGIGVQELPPGTLPGNQPEALLTMAGVVPWAVLSDFPEELAYEFVTFYISICGELPEYHAIAKLTANPQNLAAGIDLDYMHPGAIRAFREAGLLPE